MIVDSDMLGLGFKKIKDCNYKKQSGVSSFVWFKNGFQMNIGKFDNGDYFMPFLNIGTTKVYLSSLEEVNSVLKLVGID